MPFNLGPWELLIILLIVMMIFGVGKLPEVGAALGKAIREFRQMASENPAKESEAGEEKTKEE